MYEFGPWTPDLPPLGSPGATEAINVVPLMKGYDPFPDLYASVTAVSARVQGAASFRDLSGSVYNFCGTATKLYKLNSTGTAYSDVSRTSGGAYSCPAEGAWSFSQFGNTVFATNGADVAQSFVMGTSTNFAALAGSPPVGKYTGVLNGFGIIANLSSAQTTVQWSAIGSVTDWAASTTTLSDSQVFYDGGPIQGIVCNDVGLVFQENSISRMVFEGPPTAFRFSRLSDRVGLRSPGSLASYDNMAFFLSNDGAMMTVGGSQLTPIGAGAVDNWIEANINDAAPYMVSAAIDPIRKLYVLAIPTNDAAQYQVNKLLLYHWPTGKWARVDMVLEYITQVMAQASVSIDDITGSIDDLTVSLDSTQFSGRGRRILAGFNTSHKMGVFTGQSLAATLETADFQLAPGRRALLRCVRPILEGNSTTTSVAVRYRDKMQDNLTTGADAAVNEYGNAPVRAAGRYHRVRMTIPAGDTWSRAVGIDDVVFSEMGRR